MKLGLAWMALAIIACGCAIKSENDPDAGAIDTDGSNPLVDGAVGAQDSGDRDGEQGRDACVPLTCEALQLACGEAPDGCGSTLTCTACEIGAFALADISLQTARIGHATVVHGSHVYVLGGRSVQALARDTMVRSVERAAIREDGTLGDFQVVAQLDEARHDHASVVLGNRIYLLGGLLWDTEAARTRPTRS